MKNIFLKSALLFAFRESRFALGNFRFFIASLFLGTAIIAGVGSLTANISDSIRQDGRILLGGDIEVSQIQQRLTSKEKNFLSGYGKLSEIATLRTMAHGGDDNSLVDLKAVDHAYPLYGTLSLKDRPYRPDILAKKNGYWGILLSEALASRLKLGVADRVKLGTEDYQVRGIVIKEPDVNSRGFQLAPGAIIALGGLLENSLVQPGSLVRYHNRLKLFQDISIENLKNNIKKKYPDRGWQLRDSRSGGAGIRRFISRMGQFMTLVGLTALLVGGIGVSNAVRAYLEEKTDIIATYKILGASGKTILIVYLSQIMLIAAGAVILGLITGALLPVILAEILKNSLPIALNMTIYLKPLLLAAYYSLSVALIFTLWPLGRAVRIPPSRLFRQTVSQSRSISQSWGYIGVISLLLLSLITVVIYMSEFRRLTAMTLGAAAMVFVILLGASAVMRWIAGKIPPPKNPVFRIALGNIYRPGNATTSIIMSLGLGLILFTTIALLENNLLREIGQKTRGETPSFFFIDIQKKQINPFVTYLKNTPGIESYRTVPNLRGRITRIKSVDATKARVKPEGRWILRGDKGITFTDKLPADNKIVAGNWWPAGYEGPPEVSISEEMAQSMDLVPGDSISVNILGRNFTLTIASVRRFSWGSFGINYVLMVDPDMLKSAPFTYVGTARAAGRDEARIYQDLNRKFPGISILRMKEVMTNILGLLGKISAAIDIMAAITIISGVLVLAGAIAAGHKARIYDAAILKVVGATRKDIIKAYVIEFILLGMITGIIAIILGSLGAYMLVKNMMEIPWQLPLYIPLGTVVASSAVTLAFGMVSIWLAMSVRPSHILRSH